MAYGGNEDIHGIDSWDRFMGSSICLSSRLERPRRFRFDITQTDIWLVVDLPYPSETSPFVSGKNEKHVPVTTNQKLMLWFLATLCHDSCKGPFSTMTFGDLTN